MACCRTKRLRPWTPDLPEIILRKWGNYLILVFFTSLRLSRELPRSLRQVTGLLLSPIGGQLLDMTLWKGSQSSENTKVTCAITSTIGTIDALPRYTRVVHVRIKLTWLGVCDEVCSLCFEAETEAKVGGEVLTLATPQLPHRIHIWNFHYMLGWKWNKKKLIFWRICLKVTSWQKYLLRWLKGLLTWEAYNLPAKGLTNWPFLVGFKSSS